MSRDHIVARFHLARWASPCDKVQILNRRTGSTTLEDPATFNRIEGFNAMVGPDGSEDPWLERDFLGRLDSDVARYLVQLENVQSPRSHMRRSRKQGWHHGHLLAPRPAVRLAMFVAAQMVRNPAWRNAVTLDTARDMKETVEIKVRDELASATEPSEIKRLEKMLGLRFLITETPTNMLPHLSGHLAYRIGQLLYERYFWAIHRFKGPMLLIGDDPVVLFSHTDQKQTGSFAQVARAKEALSIYRPLEDLVEEALDVVSASNKILMPIGPSHALVLSHWEELWPPGRYDQPGELARIYNTLIAISSTQWLGWLPETEPHTLFTPQGASDSAEEAVHVQSPRHHR